MVLNLKITRNNQPSRIHLEVLNHHLEHLLDVEDQWVLEVLEADLEVEEEHQVAIQLEELGDVVAECNQDSWIQWLTLLFLQAQEVKCQICLQCQVMNPKNSRQINKVLLMMKI